MSDPERVRRPIAPRTVPIRRWEGVLGSPAAAEATKGRGQPDDVLTRSVEAGYRVVDDYLARGQEIAQRMRHGSYGAAEAAHDVQGVAEQLVRTAADFAGAWVEFFALTGRDVRSDGAAKAGTSSAVASDAPETSQSQPDAIEPDAATPHRFRLRVSTIRPVETSLEITGHATGRRLSAQRLRLADGSARIDGVAVDVRDDGEVVIGVTIHEAQTPGRYTGPVIDDATNVPIGTITITVE